MDTTQANATTQHSTLEDPSCTSEVGRDSEGEIRCYVCQVLSEEDKKLRKFNDQTWASIKKAASLRKNLTADKYASVTKKVNLQGECDNNGSTQSYHPSCYRNYTAVKRPKPVSPPEAVELKKPKVTRQTSTLPKSDQQGLLKGACIFCGKNRKKTKGKEERTLKVSTFAGCESLRERAERSKNERIKSIIRTGVDLIAKEAEYHKSCRILFDKETAQVPEQVRTPYQYHRCAFASICNHIEKEIIQNHRSLLVSGLIGLYKSEYIGNGGDAEDVATYSSQNLLRKITDKFGNQILVGLMDMRNGNFIYSSDLTEEDARAQLHTDKAQYKEDEEIRSTALYLRSRIMELPKSKTPNPATVENLKESAPEIPRQVDLFFRTLLCGLTENIPDPSQEVIDRKIIAMSSDTIYNVSHGTVKPWKHYIMGLGLSSLTGSKIAVQILNRAGHTINYNDIKGLETEFAYSVAADERDSPDGIRLDPTLATACVWDNNDANVETIDGKETLHATVGHTYQNIVEKNADQPISNDLQFLSGRNRRKFMGNEREIPPFRKALSNAKFVSATVTRNAETTSTVERITEEPDGSDPIETEDAPAETTSTVESIADDPIETGDTTAETASTVEPIAEEPNGSNPFQAEESTVHAEITSTVELIFDEANTSDSNEREDRIKPLLKPLDLYWFWKSGDGNTPLHAGFTSKFVKDSLPLQRICYMDPISRSPTNNDVVRETMVRSVNVANETKQEYSVVTYDLAIALKAYSIQAIEAPLFNNLLIMLGNFHVELAFYGAVGTLVNGSGIGFILTEAGVLAEGSLMGFMKGKFYNRCTRVHELLANVMERKLYERFLTNLTTEECEVFELVMSIAPSDPIQLEAHLSDPVISQHLQKYENYFKEALSGNIGKTAQYWTVYIYLINRIHRELQRCVKTNNVAGYIDILPAVLDAYFALNRPNYARWGTLFFQKLEKAGPELRQILENGAFSIRRTKKDYSRSAVDLSLEQTVNRDASSQKTGIVAFRNSELAMRRWSLTMTQRAMAVTELRTLAGIEQGENAASQCRQYRIRKDNQDMITLSEKIGELCNPYSDDISSSDAIVNLATGKTAANDTETYLLRTLERGQDARKKFLDEWEKDNSRFLRTVKRIRVHNFASENIKKKAKAPASEIAKKNAESLRDMFIRMIIVVAQNTTFDLQSLLSYPITEFPLSLAHCDGTPVKTQKASLLKKLESLQTEIITESEFPVRYSQVYDGGLVIHSVLSQVKSGASYASIARRILSMVCSGKAEEVHICLDKYVDESIKGSERRFRGAEDRAYVITGSEQTTRQSGQQLLKNGIFKNELSKFIMNEWKQDHYWSILGGKTLIASYGGECLRYVPDTEQHITVEQPPHLQGDHEEADTLIAFHVASITDNILVRASDTDVLVILIGAYGQKRPEVRSMSNVIMDCGTGNTRRYINVNSIAANLEQQKPGLARALPAYHSFTGCDFTSAFYRQGKVKPLEIIDKDKTGRFINFFISMGESDDPDLGVASEFVCRMYSQSKTKDVNEARYNKLLQMTGKINQENPLANVKKIDCALLPPSKQSLKMKLQRAHYVAQLWSRASLPVPSAGLTPTDYGWCLSDDLLLPNWFEGPAIPENLFRNDNLDHSVTADESDSDDTIIYDANEIESAGTDELSDSGDEPWSEDSDSNVDDVL